MSATAPTSTSWLQVAGVEFTTLSAAEREIPGWLLNWQTDGPMAWMLTATPIPDQVRAARGERLRVLIVGAGVAGLTLAQLLRGQGLHPVLVERASQEQDEAGYMLGLMPFVDPVLDRLGIVTEYLERSVGMHRYRLRGRTGRALREYSLDAVMARFGHYRGIERGRLLQVLAAGGNAPVAFRTTVTGLEQAGGTVRVRLADQAATHDAEFDAVVAADGLHSTTRELILPGDRVHTYDTGWGGWVAWTEADDEPDLYEETWGAGFFLGLYPVPDRIGAFLAGPRSDTAVGPAAFGQHARAMLRTGNDRAGRALAAVTPQAHPYYWSMTDVRCSTWVTGRVALLGDAAAGFLPTAGVGAAMAVESAGALAQRLAAASAASVHQALRSYERHQRPRAESAQENSRQLARLMFRRGRVLTRGRDLVTPLIGVHTALGPIRALLENR